MNLPLPTQQQAPSEEQAPAEQDEQVDEQHRETDQQHESTNEGQLHDDDNDSELHEQQDDLDDSALDDDYIPPDQLEAEFERIFGQQQANDVPEPKIDFGRGDHVEIAERLAQDLTEEFGSAPVNCEGANWVYDRGLGVWVKLRPQELSQRVERYSGMSVAGEKKPRPLKLKYADISGILKVLGAHLDSPAFFAKAPVGITFSNGFLRITNDTFELLAHSQRNRATMRLDFAYDSAATAPRFQQFLNEIFRDDAEAAEKIALLQQHAGACLLGVAPKYQLALVLLGSGANGKSTYLDVVTGVFPDEWKASIPPHAWGHEYDRSRLPGIRLNAVNELPDRELMANEMVKAIISGDEIQARVIREQPFTFRPVAGQLFATNDLPQVTDQSHGLWRRFAVVLFPRTFDESEMVRGLAETILNEERPGIINWMLDGAKTLLERGKYVVPTSSDTSKKTWRIESDSVVSFLEDEMERVAEVPAELTTTKLEKLEYTRASRAYELYKNYCRTNGFKPCNKNNFSKKVIAQGIERVGNKDGRWYAMKERPYEPTGNGPALRVVK